MTASPTAPLVYDPFAHATQEDPYPVYDALLEHAPVYRNEQRGFWALTRFADVQAAARDWRRFSSGAGVRVDDLLALAGPSFITMDPPRHDVLRAVVRPGFQLRAIAELEQTVERTARRLLDGLAGGGEDEIDLAGGFAKRLPALVICELMGLPEVDAAMLKGWGDALLECGADGTTTPAARAAAASLRAYWQEQLADRRRRPRDDLVGHLVAQGMQEELLPEEEIGMCNLLFEAGNSTTTSLLGNGLLALFEHPRERAWLVANPDGLPRAIEELLRWDAPVQNQLRVSTTAVELHGAEIPAGARVMLVLGAANRDPRAWADPGVLRLAREPRRHLAFGEGIHHCIGAPLARLEGRVALRLLLERMPAYEVVEAERFHDVTLRMLTRLVVRPGRGSGGRIPVRRAPG